MWAFRIKKTPFTVGMFSFVYLLGKGLNKYRYQVIKLGSVFILEKK